MRTGGSSRLVTKLINDQPDSAEMFQHVVVASGRRIAFSELGAHDGYPALYAHGFPSSRREAMLIDAAARDVGVRLVSIDRPGYGDSDPLPQRRIADWPDDAAAVADALALERFGLVGVSGGGPYALACAARLSQRAAHPLQGRVSHCLLVCPLGPIYEDELLARMHWAARMNLRVGQHPDWVADMLFGTPMTAALERWPAIVEKARSFAAPPADRRVLDDPETTAILNQTIADAMRNGAKGARSDLRLYTHPWEIRFEAIGLPVRIWHGQADGTVPIEHARWYARQIATGDLTELPEEGHYSVPLCYSREILAELISS
jgi:pimeloyl-ACP methyl ester carboxylesterase